MCHCYYSKLCERTEMCRERTESLGTVTIDWFCLLEGAGLSKQSTVKHLMSKSDPESWQRDERRKERKERKSGCRKACRREDEEGWQRKGRKCEGMEMWNRMNIHRQNVGMSFQEMTFTQCKRLPAVLKPFTAAWAQETQPITKVIFKENRCRASREP